jgi:hypothetical protein
VDASFERWFFAGLLSGIHRFLVAGTTSDYFAEGVGMLVRRHGDPMRKFLEILLARYEALTPEEQTEIGGPYVGLHIEAPCDLPQRMAQARELYRVTGWNRARFLTTSSGLRVPFDGDRLSLPPGLLRLYAGATREAQKERDRGEEGQREAPPGGAGIRVEDTSQVTDQGIGPPPGPCCQELGVTFNRIEVRTVTTPRHFNDNVYVTGLVWGGEHLVHPQGGNRFHWPGSVTDPDSISMGSGDYQEPGVPVLRVQPGQNRCHAEIHVALTFWEGDWEDFEEALRKTAQQFSGAMAAMASAAAGVPLDPGLFASIVNKLLDKIGLSDELMGELHFSIVDWGFTRGRKVSQRPWVPPLPVITRSGVRMEKDETDYLVLRKTLNAHGGTWLADVTVYQLCG